MGPASLMAWRMANAAAILKLTSFESTECALPSSTVTAMSTTGYPKTPPLDMVSMTPFSTAGMYWRGIAPPTTSSWKTNPSPARQRLEPQMAHTELAVSAGLLLVLAFGVGRHRDRFAVGDAQLLTLDVDVALAVQAFEGDGRDALHR